MQKTAMRVFYIMVLTALEFLSFSGILSATTAATRKASKASLVKTHLSIHSLTDANIGKVMLRSGEADEESRKLSADEEEWGFGAMKKLQNVVEKWQAQRKLHKEFKTWIQQSETPSTMYLKYGFTASVSKFSDADYIKWSKFRDYYRKVNPKVAAKTESNLVVL